MKRKIINIVILSLVRMLITLCSIRMSKSDKESMLSQNNISDNIIDANDE